MKRRDFLALSAALASAYRFPYLRQVAPCPIQRA